MKPKQCFCCKDNISASKRNRVSLSNKKELFVRLIKLEHDVKLLQWIRNNLKTNQNFENFMTASVEKINCNRKPALQKNGIKRNEDTTDCLTPGVIETNCSSHSNQKPIKSNLNKTNNKNLNGKKEKTDSTLLELSKNKISNFQKNFGKSTIRTAPALIKQNTIERKGKINKKKKTLALEKNNKSAVKPTENVTFARNKNRYVNSISDISFDFNENNISVGVIIDSDEIKEECLSDTSDDKDQTLFFMENDIQSSCSKENHSPKSIDLNSPKKHTTCVVKKRKLPNKDLSTCDVTKHNGSKKNFLELEEPLSLISQLTGCNVAPSKLKLLSLPTNDNDNRNINSDEVGSETSPKTPDENSSCSESVQLSKEETSVKTSNQSDDNAIRTIYDLMREVSIMMPSWNLHILPDTNSFCIGQLTRNCDDIPQLSKCIVLDDYFNAKVYIYKKHCPKFDGVYDSEDRLYLLITEVDRYQ